MQLTVFGATGPAGRLVVRQALGQGHGVTAYARNRGKIDELNGAPGLTVVAGELDDAVGIGTALEGADAVISLLGPGRDKASIAPLVPGTRAIVEAMAETGVRRLVATSTPSAPDPADRRDLRIQAMVAGIRLAVPHAYRTIITTAQIVRESSLDWTLVRLPLLHSKPVGRPARARQLGEPGGLRLSRVGLAEFLVDEATHGSWNGQAPVLADD